MKKSADKNVISNLNLNANWGLKRGNVHSLMKKVKENKKKENKEKVLFVASAISILVISGIIISF